MAHRDRRRLTTVLLAPLVALATWGLIRLAGIELEVETAAGTVGPRHVLAAALAGALAAWAAVLLLERRSRRPAARWPLIGSTALSASMIGPSHLADGAGAVALIGLHVVTGVVVIVGFAATLPACRGRSRRVRSPALGGTGDPGQ